MDNQVKYSFVEKQNREYVVTYSNTDPTYVYERLAHELIAKKLCCCTYIKSIKRVNLYNGFVRIVINYDHGRGVYTVKEH